MRLLFVSHSLPPHGRPLENVGGMQRVAVDLHDGLLADRSLDVTTLVLRSSWEERGFRTPLFLARALREVRRMARAQKIDAVLFSSMVTGVLAVPLRRVLRRNRIVSAAIVNGLDATMPTWPYPPLVRKAFESLDLVLPISTATGAACIERGLDRSKAKVVPLGIRLDRFAAVRDKPSARQRLVTMVGLAGEPRLILCSVGRLVPRKGVAWFVSKVMTKLPGDTALVVVGEGEERRRIEDAISDAGLKGRVFLLGAASDSQLEAVYQGADLFVMPNLPVANDMEGFGLVMLEAGLLGLPVIGSSLEGIPDVVTAGQNGKLVPSGDADAFVEAILSYHADSALLRADSVRAREWVVSRFGWSGVIQRYIAELTQTAMNVSADRGQQPSLDGA